MAYAFVFDAGGREANAPGSPLSPPLQFATFAALMSAVNLMEFLRQDSLGAPMQVRGDKDSMCCCQIYDCVILA